MELLPVTTAEASYLTTEQAEFYELAFGHTPTFEEHQEYVRVFGKVPSPSDFRAYLASSEAESRYLEQQRDASSETGERGSLEPMAVWSHKFFEYGKWIGRDVWSLSLMPKQAILGGSAWEKAVNLQEGWKAVYKKFKGSRHWTRYKSQGADESMEKQYYCHGMYGMIKTPWSLEPSRKPADVSSVTCD